MNTPTDFIGANEVAELLGVTPNTVYKWRREGKGPNYYRFATQHLYSKAEVEDYIRNSHVKVHFDERDPARSD